VDSFEDKMLVYAGIELLILPIMAPFVLKMMVAAFAGKGSTKAEATAGCAMVLLNLSFKTKVCQLKAF